MDLTDKIKLLKKELGSLKKEIEILDSAHKTSQDMITTLSNLDLTNNKNKEIYIKIAKTAVFNELELLRTKIKTIRKFSSETADRLEKEVQQYEDSTKTVLSFFDNNTYRKKLDSMSRLEVLTMFFHIFNVILSNRKLHEMVDLCRYSIRDTLEKMEK